MPKFNQLCIGSLVVLTATACRITNSGPGRSDLASARSDASDELSARLFYKYKLSSLKTEIQYSPDFDSQIVLTVDIEAASNPPMVKSYLNGSTGYEQTITFDLASGGLKRVNKQVGNEQVLDLKSPRTQAETRSNYVEVLKQLLDQVSAIREGRNHKNAQRLELNELVTYLEQVLREVDAAGQKREFTGPDAEKLITTLSRLGLSPQADAQGFSVITLSSLSCVRGDGSSRYNPEAGIRCELITSSATRPAEAESEPIYRLLVKNGVKERKREGDMVLELHNLRCVQYTVTHGTTKCYFEE